MKGPLICAGRLLVPSPPEPTPVKAGCPRAQATGLHGGRALRRRRRQSLRGKHRRPRRLDRGAAFGLRRPERHDAGGHAARDRLIRVVGCRRLNCVAVLGRSGRVVVYDRVIAFCRLDGRRVGDLLRATGGREGGNQGSALARRTRAGAPAHPPGRSQSRYPARRSAPWVRRASRADCLGRRCRRRVGESAAANRDPDHVHR